MALYGGSKYSKQDSLHLFDNVNYTKEFSIKVEPDAVHFRSDIPGDFMFHQRISVNDIVGISNAPLGMNAKLGEIALSIVSLMMDNKDLNEQYQFIPGMRDSLSQQKQTLELISEELAEEQFKISYLNDRIDSGNAAHSAFVSRVCQLMGEVIHDPTTNKPVSLQSQIQILKQQIHTLDLLHSVRYDDLLLKFENLAEENVTLKEDVKAISNDVSFLKRKIQAAFPS